MKPKAVIFEQVRAECETISRQGPLADDLQRDLRKLLPGLKESPQAFLFREPSDEKSKAPVPFSHTWIVQQEDWLDSEFRGRQASLNEFVLCELRESDIGVNFIGPCSRNAMEGEHSGNGGTGEPAVAIAPMNQPPDKVTKCEGNLHIHDGLDKTLQPDRGVCNCAESAQLVRARLQPRSKGREK